jgi:hypothetical protein
VLAAGFIGSACRSSVGAFGDSVESAQRNADELFAALEYRFHNVQREPKFAQARQKIARLALVPSALFSDTSVWPIISEADSSRAIFLRATYDGNRYFFTAAASAPTPQQLGDEIHFMRLKSLGRNDYEWQTTVDHAVGHVKPAALAAVIVAVLTASEGRSGANALADARSAFPRATQHLSQLFTVDSLLTTQSDGATTAALGISVHPERLKASYPGFAAYVSKYIVPSVYRLRLTDARGSTYFDLTGRDGRVLVRLRSRGGKLVALTGAPQPIPDSLLLLSDFSAKYRVFRVGYTNLVADFVIERGEHLRAWMLRFRKEPGWHFPLAVDKLIRSPLRRPFQDRGIELRLGVRDDMGPKTLSFRQARVIVNESAIMRWLGRLGANAFADFSGKTEAEENRFLSLLFAALRADIGALQ